MKKAERYIAANIFCSETVFCWNFMLNDKLCLVMFVSFTKFSLHVVFELLNLFRYTLIWFLVNKGKNFIAPFKEIEVVQNSSL